MVVDLNGCARCASEAHPGLQFEPLTNPIVVLEHDVEEGHEVTYSHWAPCPVNGQPILLRSTEIPDAPAEPDPATA